MPRTEQPRTRKGGTQVFAATSYPEVINAARHVLEHGYAKVNGKMLDATTANMLVSIHEKLNATNLDTITRMFQRLVSQAAAKGFTTAEGLTIAFVKVVDVGWKCVR